jgi:hypothetical protein
MQQIFVVLWLCLSLSAALAAGHGNVNADGANLAPAGTAVAPGLFNQGTGTTGATWSPRPTWRVAGVDYPVGPDSGVTLVVPTVGNLPGCATISGGTITVNSAPCTLNGFDFTASGGGMEIYMPNGFCPSGGAIVISNSKFVHGANINGTWPSGLADIVHSFGTHTCTLDFHNNIIDGAGCNFAGNKATSQSGLLSWTGSGAISIKYNQFLNGVQHGVELGNGNPMNGGPLTIQYNYFRNFAYGFTVHGNPIILQGTTGYDTVLINYNTFVGLPGPAGEFAPVGVCAANAAVQGNGITALAYVASGCGCGGPWTLTNTMIDHNVYISPPVRGNGQGFTVRMVDCDVGPCVSPQVSNSWMVWDISPSFPTYGWLLSTATNPLCFNNLQNGTVINGC